MTPWGRHRAAALALFAGLYACATFGAVITLEPANPSGGQVSAPVSVAAEPNDDVAGVQFDLIFDPSQYALVDVLMGDSAANAGKDVVFTDAFEGLARVIVVGMNQEVMPDGVVATVVLESLNGDTASNAVDIDSVVVSDPFGNRVPASSQKVALEANEAEFDISETEASSDALESGPGEVGETSSANEPTPAPADDPTGITRDSNAIGSVGLSGATNLASPNQARRNESRKPLISDGSTSPIDRIARRMQARNDSSKYSEDVVRRWPRANESKQSPKSRESASREEVAMRSAPRPSNDESRTKVARAMPPAPRKRSPVINDTSAALDFIGATATDQRLGYLPLTAKALLWLVGIAVIMAVRAKFLKQAYGGRRRVS